MPLKILHIFGRMNRGGAEMRTLDIMRQLDPRRFELHFCALSGLPGDLDDEIRALGGEVHFVPLGSSFPRCFRALLQRQRFDVVHSHVHYSSGYILRLASQSGVPVRVAHFRMTRVADKDDWRRRLQRPVLRYWINQYATNILAVSRATMSVVWPHWEREPRCRIIYNGLNALSFENEPDRVGVRREFRLPDDCRLYVHVGRFVGEKNHIRLTGILAELSKLDSSARLLLVGQGDNEVESKVRALLCELNLETRVVFTGLRTDIPRLLKAADLLLFPSLWEGLPGTVLEACAAGTPVLASDLPGVQEIAAHFSTVHYLPLSASDREWAELANKLGAPQSASQRMSRCSAFAESVFNIEDCVAAHCAAWEGEI
jgi:glycosyltransferase involved in cell wall biosynthesis